ncbi:MAG: hypothetical protein K6E29_03940 [Cyanobacteria bacterium RUI128]|nr:hypothetical protein [Cyanobacteria bacterium RUI128]
MKIAPVCYVGKSSYQPNKNISFQAKFPNGAIKPKHIKEFVAYQDFARYNPIRINFGDYTIPVHNEEIARRLQPEYTSGQFRELFDFTKSKGTFDYIMEDKTGFVKTSLINRKENVLMSDMIWITDTCNNMELVKTQHPEDCTKVINKMADLYEGQKESFYEVIAVPSKYNKSGIRVWQGQTGIGHCFVPQTHKPHQWFAKTRLESVGNYLQQSSDIISTGLNNGKYGYRTAEEIPDTVIDSIANCTKYLKSIHYPTARSCGAWEEQTFMGSLTSDTSICNQGLRDVMRLMYEPTENPKILKVRERILSSKHGDVFEDKKGLESVLKDGEKRISEQPDIETLTQPPRGADEKVSKDYIRYYDSAMTFMPQTEKIDPKDIYRDSAKKLFVLKKLEKNLVRDNGAIRYKGDEYLNLDYHTLKDQRLDNKRRNEAEWFLVSEISCGYGAVARQILDHIAQKGSMNEKDKKLLTMAMRGQTEHINRSYARITPRNMTKSNRYSCPAYKVPEAYEAVTVRNGKVKFVPGAHSPLTWAESSLHKASNMYLENLERIEKL